MKTITVRGVSFSPLNKSGYIDLSELTKLYLVFKALEGDELAIEILNAAKTVITDKDKNIIWPVKK